MTTTGKFRLSLHVSHPTLSSKEIIEALPLKPRYSRSVGADRATPRGTKLDGVYDETDVSFVVSEVLDNDEVLVAERVESALNDLAREAIGRIIASGGNCFFLIGLYSEGNLLCDFSPQLLSQIAGYGLGLKLDFYGGPEREGVDP